MTFLLMLSIPKNSLLQVWTEVQKPGDGWRLPGQVCLPDPTSHIFGRNSTLACSTPYSCRGILALWWHPMFFWPLRSNLTLWKTWWTSHFFAATVAVLLLKWYYFSLQTDAVLVPTRDLRLSLLIFRDGLGIQTATLW